MSAQSPLSPLSLDSNDSWSSSIKSNLDTNNVGNKNKYSIMPIARDPSQRVRDWVKAGGGSRTAKASPSASSSSVTSPTEIIHLGGSRVGTPTTASSQSTRSGFSGHARTNTTDDAHKTQHLMPDRNRSNTTDSDRPITKWFEDGEGPRFKPQHIITSYAPKGQNVTISPIQTDDLRGELSPPPLRVPNGQNLNNLGRKPSQNNLNRKPSLPTLLTPPGSASSSETAVAPAKPLQRKLSKSKWKALPARPKDNPVITVSTLDKVEEYSDDHFERPSKDTRIGEATTLHVGQMIRSDKHITHFFTQPPPIGPPPPAPAPEKAAPGPINVYGKICLEIPRPDSTTIGGNQLAEVKMSDIKVREAELRATTGGRKIAPGRHTREERFWLHKTYRGEVPFLRAWGLDIKSEEERSEGLVIMRELMAAEREKKERKEREEQGLKISMEDDQRTLTNSVRDAAERGTIPLVAEVRASQAAQHSRQESELSVTDEYVSSRISTFR